VSVIIKGKNLRKPHTVRYWMDGRQNEGRHDQPSTG